LDFAIMMQGILPNPDEVLAELGFTVNWKGLDPDAASIELAPSTT
jgi:hypothetical protein